MNKEMQLVSIAYIALLQVSPGSYGRAANQNVYAALRDWLALMSGESAESIQDKAEQLVAGLRK